MTKPELRAECLRRAAHERMIADAYGQQQGRERWIEEWKREALFYDALAEALRGES